MGYDVSVANKNVPTSGLSVSKTNEALSELDHGIDLLRTSLLILKEKLEFVVPVEPACPQEKGCSTPQPLRSTLVSLIVSKTEAIHSLFLVVDKINKEIEI